jgi:transcriptional regulator with XRE-family HTH domain
VPDKIDKRTKPLMVGVGAHLRQVREDLGISQVQLATKIKMEPTNLAKIERGQKNVTVDTLRRIADGLGVSLVVRFDRGSD